MKEQAVNGTLATRIARELSALSLDYEEGAFIGAEDGLLAQLGVSRPTLRQAAKIVEAEGMISVRRGTRGGFYAARPNVKDAIRALNRYLRLSGVTIRDVTVVSSISEEAAGRAADCDDDGLRDTLRAMLAELESIDTPRAMMDFDTRFLALLGEMAGNPVISVVIALIYSFGWEEQGIHLYASDADKQAARRLYTDISKAVLDREGDLARFMMRRRLTVIHAWINGADTSQLMPINQLPE